MNEEECILEIEKLGERELNNQEKALVGLAFAYGIMEGINKIENTTKEVKK